MLPTCDSFHLIVSHIEAKHITNTYKGTSTQKRYALQATKLSCIVSQVVSTTTKRTQGIMFKHML